MWSLSSLSLGCRERRRGLWQICSWEPNASASKPLRESLCKGIHPERKSGGLAHVLSDSIDGESLVIPLLSLSMKVLCEHQGHERIRPIETLWNHRT